MSRCLLMILVVAVFTGCGHNHELVWPYHRAKGGSEPGEEALYGSVQWQFRWVINYPQVKASGDSNRPGFSVRLPDGTVLTPDQITIDRTEATLKDESGLEPHHDDQWRVAVFDYANGRLKVEFGTFDDAKQIAEVHAWLWPKRDIPGSDLAVGNPDGTKLVVLPATRDELVEVFGKPGLERKSAKNWCLVTC